MASSSQLGWDRNYTLTEADLHEKELSDDIGLKWRDLARKLGFKEAFIDGTEKQKHNCTKECCIEVLIRWLQREGKGATAEKLFEALDKIGLKNLAERFPLKRSDPNQNSDAVIHDFQKKVTELGTKVKELEDKVLTLTARIEELENEGQQKGECEGDDVFKEAEQDARESHVREVIKKCDKKLKNYVTQPLIVPEVRQDMLPRTAVTVDVLKVLSEHLEEQYNTALDIAPEAYQCSEDLRELFYNFAYHALKTEHKQINHKMNDLEEKLNSTPTEDKEEFANLMLLQNRRKDLVNKLEKWRHHFSPPMEYSRSLSDATELKLREQNNETTTPPLVRERLETHPIDKKKHFGCEQ
ncbi:uncharacterized protein LOC141876609 [Acropora palmata]|uniref:uncharacterized protein LOC141876609 n=1 Tax=Acropora palmata TaxID=6131 RepID=UPI003DA0B1E9